MRKIDFKNYPNTSTPLSAETFNLLQSNIELTLNEYSTDETIIGTWMGKYLYRKVIEINSKDPSNTYSHGISNVDVFVNAYGTANFTGIGEGWQPVPRVVPTNIQSYGLGVGNLKENTFTFGIGTNYGTFIKAYIILEYTKTTN